MQIETIVLGELDTNCYLMWDEHSLEAVVIDPADSGDVISQKILEENLHLKAIILTHGHFDHILGLLELKLNFMQAPIMMHKADLFLVESVQSRAAHWLGREVDPAPPPDVFLAEDDVVMVGDEELAVLETPGHTPGSVCLVHKQVLFSGDTLFADDAVGRTDFKYSDYEKLQHSLAKIQKVAKKRLIYPGHGQSFRL